jgi:hypothetical protein
MPQPIDLESVDLAQLARRLRETCGPSIEGPLMGRTCFRDAVVKHLGCSELEAEQLVDTMVQRGFLEELHRALGWCGWAVHEEEERRD